MLKRAFDGHGNGIKRIKPHNVRGLMEDILVRNSQCETELVLIASRYSVLAKAACSTSTQRTMELLAVYLGNGDLSQSS